jgi:hypothetical protein
LGRRRPAGPGQAGTPVATPAATPVAAACTDGAFGASGIGDGYFPTMGNGGYDVGHYDLALTLDPEQGDITDGVAVIAASAQIDLCAFNLDYLGPAITAVAVDGQPAGHSRRGAELTISPAQAIPAGSSFVVEVRYQGRPGAARSRSGRSPASSTAAVGRPPRGRSTSPASRAARRPGTRSTATPPTRRPTPSA